MGAARQHRRCPSPTKRQGFARTTSDRLSDFCRLSFHGAPNSAKALIDVAAANAIKTTIRPFRKGKSSDMRQAWSDSERRVSGEIWCLEFQSLTLRLRLNGGPRGQTSSNSRFGRHETGSAIQRLAYSFELEWLPHRVGSTRVPMSCLGRAPKCLARRLENRAIKTPATLSYQQKYQQLIS